MGVEERYFPCGIAFLTSLPKEGRLKSFHLDFPQIINGLPLILQNCDLTEYTRVCTLAIPLEEREYGLM